IELGQSTPTINVLWKIARALGVPFSALMSQAASPVTTVMQASHARILRSRNGDFSSRALFPMDRPRNVEFYELRLAPRSVEHAAADARGPSETLVAPGGSVETPGAGGRRPPETGHATRCEPDTPHSPPTRGGPEAVISLVMPYGPGGYPPPFQDHHPPH